MICINRFLLDFLKIAVGTFLIAFGVSVFLTPNYLSSGGVTSIGTILLYLFQIPISVTNIAVNGLLFLLGWRVLGHKSVFKTVIGVLLFSLFLEVTTAFPEYTDDRLLSAISGGGLIGIGVGLVLRAGASTGGSDFMGLMFQSWFPHISTALFILLIDCAVLGISGIVFRSLTVTLYSAITLAVSAKTIDFILSFGDVAKSVFIFSDSWNEISEKVMGQFERGATGFYCKGMYSGENRMTVLCVVRPKELPKLIRLVREIDSGAFLIINDSREVLGEGFKRDSLYHK